MDKERSNKFLILIKKSKNDKNTLKILNLIYSEGFRDGSRDEYYYLRSRLML